MRIPASVGVIALLSGAAFGQSRIAISGDATPKFDVADVHASPRTTNMNVFMTGGVLRAGRCDLRNATMLDLIRTAWNVDPATVLGGPNWLELNRFDVIAKAVPGSSPETLRSMLKALLADRFKLVLHNDTKPMPAFALTVPGKGKAKLKESDGSGNRGCQGQPRNSAPGTAQYVLIACRGITMEAFVRNLRLMAGDYLTIPVFDSTGLAGGWDFDLKWNPRSQIPAAGADAITIFDAVEKQLGLKPEAQKLPAPVIVVDSVNEKPTANPPGVAEALPPPPPAEFEVANIKLSMLDARPFGRIQPGGRLDVRGITLKMLIDIAWDINDDEMLVGAPKWLDSTRYDVLAKASTTTSGPASALQVDIDDVKLMLRALLKERFKLATQTEERPVTAYTLVSARPKLTKADPANRTGCKEAATVAKDPRDTNPSRSRLITCLNITMAQFADQLQRLASGYIHNPVQDETGIDGNWDFTLSFSTAGLMQNAGQPAGTQGGGAAAGQSAGAPPASDPSGGLSLFDAVNKQLGLKLDSRKRPIPVLVIDHVEEKPTDN